MGKSKAAAVDADRELPRTNSNEFSWSPEKVDKKKKRRNSITDTPPSAKKNTTSDGNPFKGKLVGGATINKPPRPVRRRSSLTGQIGGQITKPMGGVRRASIGFVKGLKKTRSQSSMGIDAEAEARRKKALRRFRFAVRAVIMARRWRKENAAKSRVTDTIDILQAEWYANQAQPYRIVESENLKTLRGAPLEKSRIRLLARLWIGLSQLRFLIGVLILPGIFCGLLLFLYKDISYFDSSEFTTFFVSFSVLMTAVVIYIFDAKDYSSQYSILTMMYSVVWLWLLASDIYDRAVAGTDTLVFEVYFLAVFLFVIIPPIINFEILSLKNLLIVPIGAVCALLLLPFHMLLMPLYSFARLNKYKEREDEEEFGDGKESATEKKFRRDAAKQEQGSIQRFHFYTFMGWITLTYCIAALCVEGVTQNIGSYRKDIMIFFLGIMGIFLVLPFIESILFSVYVVHKKLMKLSPILHRFHRRIMEKVFLVKKKNDDDVESGKVTFGSVGSPTRPRNRRGGMSISEGQNKLRRNICSKFYHRIILARNLASNTSIFKAARVFCNPKMDEWAIRKEVNYTRTSNTIDRENWDRVAVVVPIRNEDPNDIERTLIHIKEKLWYDLAAMGGFQTADVMMYLDGDTLENQASRQLVQVLLKRLSTDDRIYEEETAMSYACRCNVSDNVRCFFIVKNTPRARRHTINSYLSYMFNKQWKNGVPAVVLFMEMGVTWSALAVKKMFDRLKRNQKIGGIFGKNVIRLDKVRISTAIPIFCQYFYSVMGRSLRLGPETLFHGHVSGVGPQFVMFRMLALKIAFKHITEPATGIVYRNGTELGTMENIVRHVSLLGWQVKYDMDIVAHVPSYRSTAEFYEGQRSWLVSTLANALMFLGKSLVCRSENIDERLKRKYADVDPARFLEIVEKPAPSGELCIAIELDRDIDVNDKFYLMEIRDNVPAEKRDVILKSLSAQADDNSYKTSASVTVIVKKLNDEEREKNAIELSAPPQKKKEETVKSEDGDDKGKKIDRPEERDISKTVIGAPVMCIGCERPFAAETSNEAIVRHLRSCHLYHLYTIKYMQDKKELDAQKRQDEHQRMMKKQAEEAKVLENAAAASEFHGKQKAKMANLQRNAALGSCMCGGKPKALENKALENTRVISFGEDASPGSYLTPDDSEMNKKARKAREKEEKERQKQEKAEAKREEIERKKREREEKKAKQKGVGMFACFGGNPGGSTPEGDGDEAPDAGRLESLDPGERFTRLRIQV